MDEIKTGSESKQNKKQSKKQAVCENPDVEHSLGVDILAILIV